MKCQMSKSKYSSFTKFLEACEFRNVLYVYNALTYGDIDPSQNANEAVVVSSYFGHTEVVSVLLEDARVDPGDQDNYAIAWASQNGNLGTVKVLLDDARVDPCAGNNRALRWARDVGCEEVVDVLLNDKRIRKLNAKSVKPIRRRKRVKIMDEF